MSVPSKGSRKLSLNTLHPQPRKNLQLIDLTHFHPNPQQLTSFVYRTTNSNNPDHCTQRGPILLTNRPRRIARRLVPKASVTVQQNSNNDNTMGRLFQNKNQDSDSNIKSQKHIDKSSHLLPISFNNGSVTYSTPGTPTSTPTLLLDNLHSNITTIATNTPTTTMLILGARSSHQSPVSMEDIALGNLKCRRWLCCARKKLWWMAPEWGTSVTQLPPETQFLLVELEDGINYGILLPLIDNATFRSTLRPPR